jgi:hypothetical protein
MAQGLTEPQARPLQTLVVAVVVAVLLELLVVIETAALAARMVAEAVEALRLITQPLAGLARLVVTE